MAHDMAPEATQGQLRNKARDILKEISRYRIDSTRIETADTTPRARGGQGIILVGTLSRTRASESMLSERFDKTLHKVLEAGFCGESNELRPEFVKIILSDEFDKLFSKACKESDLYKKGKIVFELAKEWVSEKNKEMVCGLKIAIKKLEWLHEDAEVLTRSFKSFVKEVSLMASLSHPNIIKFLGFVEDIEKGDAWTITPWEGNGNVREFLQSGEWDIPERISLVQDTAKGLEYLHTRDPPICHGDLKSLNILVNASYRAVTTDFGSARIRRRVEAGTRSGMSCQAPINDGIAKSTSPQVQFNTSTLDLTLTGPAFSLRWAAPEVLRDEMQDLPSDMWAIGWICWEIVTGRIPFEGVNNEAVIITHALHGKLPAIRKDAQLSHVLRLCSLMSECWLSQPAKRIDASTFLRKVGCFDSGILSPRTPEDQKTQTACRLLTLGKMYQFQSNLAKAESHYLSALEIATQTEDEALVGRALYELGNMGRERSKFGEAERSYKQAH